METVLLRSGCAVIKRKRVWLKRYMGLQRKLLAALVFSEYVYVPRQSSRGTESH